MASYKIQTIPYHTEAQINNCINPYPYPEWVQRQLANHYPLPFFLQYNLVLGMSISRDKIMQQYFNVRPYNSFSRRFYRMWVFIL